MEIKDLKENKKVKLIEILRVWTFDCFRRRLGRDLSITLLFADGKHLLS